MRVKEAPAQALRAVFAGIGQLLGVSDRARGKSAEAPAKSTETPAKPAGAAAKPAATPPEAAPAANATVASPETFEPKSAVVSEPETATKTETAAPEPAAPEAAATEATAPEAAPEPAATEPAALPLANYDDLSIASLRARLRNLSPEQLRALIEYEKAHQGRAEVITMFERRIAKILAGETSSFPAIK